MAFLLGCILVMHPWLLLIPMVPAFLYGMFSK